MMTIGMAMFAPPASGEGASISTRMLVIVGIVVVLGVLAAIGWRAPDRSPKIEEKIEHEEAE
jgi:hypothetical protein